jgi:hypothetical protein
VITIVSEEVGASISRKVRNVMAYMGFTCAKTVIRRCTVTILIASLNNQLQISWDMSNSEPTIRREGEPSVTAGQPFEDETHHVTKAYLRIKFHTEGLNILECSNV